MIAEILSKINRPTQQREVKAIQDNLFYDNTKDLLAEAEERIKKLESEKQDYKKRNVELSESLAEKSKSLQDAVSEKEEYEKNTTELKKTKAEITKLKKELFGTKEELREAEESIVDYKERLVITAKELKNTKTSLLTSEERLSNTLEKFRALQEEKRVYIELIQAIENEIAKVKKENKDNSENISKTQNHLRTSGKSLYDGLQQRRQNKKVSQSSRWSGDKSSREVVQDAVRELTQNKTDVEFTIKDVESVIHKTYPNFKGSTTNAQIIQDCPNHPSRKHHTSKHNYYWRVERGKYRLFDPEKDKIEDLDDSIQT